MINIDLQNNLFKVTIPKNEMEFEYLQTESLMAIGAFLVTKERKEQRTISDKEILNLINLGKIFVTMTKTHNTKEEQQ